MKTLFLSLLTLFLLPVLSAQSAYEAGMQQAFQLLENEQKAEALAYFERIGQAATEEWVPLYWATHLLVHGSFEIEDAVERDVVLKKAKSLLETAQERSPDNPELLTLEGFLYTSYVASDPATFGMTYSGVIMALHRQALAIDPDNPRAGLNLVEYEMNQARFFGQDMAPFCERLQTVVTNFETYQSDVPFAPQGGKERAVRHLESCDE